LIVLIFGLNVQSTVRLLHKFLYPSFSKKLLFQVYESKYAWKHLNLEMESTPSSGAFTGATLAEKLNKLNASQQSIESILARPLDLY